MRQIQDLGFRVIQWNLDSNDWRVADRPPPYLADHVNDMIPRNDHRSSYIILQHETHRNTVANQRQIIKDLKRKGYKLVSMTECLGNARLYRRRSKKAKST